VEAVEQQIQDLHSFVLLRHGNVIAQGWWSPYEREAPHMLFSLSKSFTSTAVGLAIHEGYFTLDDAVTSFFPEDVPARISKNLADMRVRHLLSMSTGHAEDTTPHMVGQRDAKWEKAFFGVPVEYQPGTHFLYNTGATYMLSAIVQKVTGQTLTDYLRPRLFDPLGIVNPVWQRSPRGVDVGGWGLNIRTEDIARFGQLYLQKGRWGDLQVIPQAWVETATALHSDNSATGTLDWAQGYGFQFWRCQHNNYRGDGAFGQYCVVMPEADAVLAITSGLGDMQAPLNLVWEILLPAFQATPLATNSSAHEALDARLSHLQIQPLQSSTAGTVWQQQYHTDVNRLGIMGVAVDFHAAVGTLTLQLKDRSEQIPIGIGHWREGMINLFSERMMMNPTRIRSNGAWQSPDLFEAEIRLVETPFVYRMRIHRSDTLTIELRVNVSFEPIETITLTCHQSPA
jgi:CubicO group peptidase (beta-lactamase class C family)